MVDGPLFFGHAPPGEVHLLPRRAVRNAHVEPVVALTAEELLGNKVPVLEVGNCARDQASDKGTVAHERALSGVHALNQTSRKHLYNIFTQG